MGSKLPRPQKFEADWTLTPSAFMASLNIPGLIEERGASVERSKPSMLPGHNPALPLSLFFWIRASAILPGELLRAGTSSTLVGTCHWTASRQPQFHSSMHIPRSYIMGHRDIPTASSRHNAVRHRLPVKDSFPMV